MAYLSLVTQGWVGDSSCLGTVDTKAYMTVGRPDITARWLKRQPNQHNMLQMVSWEALPTLKEVFRHPGVAPPENLGIYCQYHERVQCPR
jgi:hypothetical protein